MPQKALADPRRHFEWLARSKSPSGASPRGGFGFDLTAGGA
jgi:hypothetical protein